MNIVLKKMALKISVLVFSFVIMFFSFLSDSLDVAQKEWFDSYQHDSEGLVLGKIIADKNSLFTENKANLGFIHANPYQVISENNVDSSILYTEYHSQYGIQGVFFSYLFNVVGVSITGMYKICCGFLAITICYLSYCASRIFGRLLGCIFFLCILFSPWVTVFARNLYWIEFSWFLPSAFAWSLFFLKKKQFKIIYFVLFFASCLIKCLSGYEYYSTVLMFSVIPYLYCFIMKNKKYDIKKIIIDFVMLSFLGVIAFVIAIILHANLRSGGNLIEGLNTIWNNDVLRRTFGGNSNNFDKIYADSLNSGFFYVLKIYFFNWSTSVISLPLIRNIDFISLICLCFIIIILQIYRRDYKLAISSVVLIIIYFLPAVSWFVLGKSHSFVHTHMNFVLWYLGGVPILIFTIVKELLFAVKLERDVYFNLIEHQNCKRKQFSTRDS